MRCTLCTTSAGSNTKADAMSSTGKLEITEHPVNCPFCGELVTVLVDCSAGPQQYVEDCQVCCRPIVLDITFDPADEVSISVRYENE